jgi:pyridoxamine 5'-phosphate oxidase
MKIGLPRLTEEDPFILFDKWFALASKREFSDPNAISLSTTDSSGFPNVRIVLMKKFNQDGLIFFSNSTSAKGREIESNSKIAACFYWKSLGRQVRLRGGVKKIPKAESDRYFSTRDRKSQIGAWASLQSKKLQKREDLEKRYNEISLNYKNKEIPRPPHWGGYIIKPKSIEFWDNRPYRLHERLVFELKKGKWISFNLFP